MYVVLLLIRRCWNHGWEKDLGHIFSFHLLFGIEFKISLYKNVSLFLMGWSKPSDCLLRFNVTSLMVRQVIIASYFIMYRNHMHIWFGVSNFSFECFVISTTHIVETCHSPSHSVLHDSSVVLFSWYSIRNGTLDRNVRYFYT